MFSSPVKFILWASMLFYLPLGGFSFLQLPVFNLKFGRGQGFFQVFSYGPCQSLVESISEPYLNFEFIDPHEGQGGFGASSAQFLALWIWLQHVKASRPFDLKYLKHSWEQFSEASRYLGSGGDLVSQYSSSSITYFKFKQ